jgi:hypothetical protein
MSVFSVQVDTQQQRVKNVTVGELTYPGVGISTLVGKQDWDIGTMLQNNVYLDGATGTVMLRPGALLDGWSTSTSGIYSKLPPSDFTATYSAGLLKTGGIVADNTVPTLCSQWFCMKDNTAGCSTITTYTVAKNQAIVVEAFVTNQTSNSDILGDVGWGSSGDYTTGVSLRFYQNGSFDIWKAGTQLAGGVSVSGQNAEYGQTADQLPGQTFNQYIKFLLIPCRQRELLILSSNGGGYSYIFDDIPEGNPMSVPITPAAPIWFYAAPGVDTNWRMALCQYASTGNAIGKLSYWRYDPGASPAGGFQKWLNQDLEGCSTSLSVADGINPFIAYVNNIHGVRLNVAMTGGSISSGSYSPTTTPFLYAAQAYTYTQLAKTSNTALELVGFTLDLTLDFADSISGTKGRIKLKNPLGIQAAGVAQDGTNKPGHLIQTIANRPWRIYDATGAQIFEGRNEAPLQNQATYIGSTGKQSWGTTDNKAESVEMELVDVWDQLEKFIFEDQWPLDGYTLLSAMTLITDLAGVTDSHGMGGFGGTWNMSTALATYVLPQGGSVTNSDFNFLIMSGDKGSEVLDRLFKTYAGNAFFSLVPQGGWSQPTLLVEADMPSTPAATLYDSNATAKYHSVASPTYTDVFRTVDVRLLPPEANDCYIQGYDYRYLRPILSHKFDYVNADPTVIPASRTPQWIGEPRAYCWNDPSLSTQAACNYAMSLIYPRVTQARSIVEVEAEYQTSLVRGALVQLVFATVASGAPANGGIINPSTGALTSTVNCRIKSISSHFQYTANDGRSYSWQPTKYVLQFGTDASILNTHATTAFGIMQEWALKLLSKSTQKIDDNDKNTWRRPYLSQGEA